MDKLIPCCQMNSMLIHIQPQILTNYGGNRHIPVQNLINWGGHSSSVIYFIYGKRIDKMWQTSFNNNIQNIRL